MKTLALLSAILFVPQDSKRKPDPEVDQVKVDAAIKKGVENLRGKLGGMEPPRMNDRGGGGGEGRMQMMRRMSNLELVLWTLVHAGVPADDPDFAKLLERMLETELECTYNVSLQAMILEEIHRVKYQWRIHQCAQFLVDNQARTGQWSYGEPTSSVKDIPSGNGKSERTDVPTGKEKEKAGSTKSGKPAVVKRLKVEKRRAGPEMGDNSNSQYAALGLRACHDAGIVLPDKVVKAAEQWWRKSQQGGGGTGGGRGWGYGESQSPYGSMSAGGVGSLVIYLYIQNKDWKRDRNVADGIQWLASNFTVEKNPRAEEHAKMHHYYYLYGLERAAILFDTETLGKHRWYAQGAKYLLKQQKEDGSWGNSSMGGGMGMSMGNDIWDTCFAILFLRRATRPLRDVATTGTKR